MNQETNRGLKWLINVLKLLIVLVLLWTIPPFLDAWRYFEEHPTKRYTYEDGQPPQEMLDKIQMVKPVQYRLYVAIFLIGFYILFDYLKNPKDHIFEKLRRHKQ